MRKFRSILWGVVLIIVGTVFALNAIGITDIDLFFDGWWTLFLIIPGLISLFRERDKTGSFILIAIGILLLLGCQKILDFNLIWKLMVPVIIIFVGIKMVFGGLIWNRTVKEFKPNEVNRHAGQNEFVAFGGNDVKMDGQTFTGSELNAIFGGMEYDLRNAIIPTDCYIKATAIFGGIDIMLPENVNVKIASHSLFGGVGTDRDSNDREGAVTIYIEGTAIFGGVEIK